MLTILAALLLKQMNQNCIDLLVELLSNLDDQEVVFLSRVCWGSGASAISLGEHPTLLTIT